MIKDLRQSIEQGFSQYGRLVYRHRYKTLLLLIIVVALLVSQLPKLTLDTSNEGFLHESDPTLHTYDQFREQFGRDELIIVSIQTQDVFTLDFLSKLKRLHDELRANVPHLDDIDSLINARNTRGTEGELIVEDLLERWPEDEDALVAIRQRAKSNPLYRNLLLSEDGRVTNVVIQTDAFSNTAQDNTEDALADFDEVNTALEIEGTAETKSSRPYLSDAENSAVVNAVRDIIKDYEGEDFQIHFVGMPVVADVLKQSMQQNMAKFMQAALLSIAVILYLLFRRLSGVLLPMLTVVMSLLSTLGMMAWLGIPFKLPTQILPSLLLAVGIGASVHLLAVFYRHLRELPALRSSSDRSELSMNQLKEEAVSYALGHSGLAIAMTSLTTAAGLASFAGAEVAPVSDLGIIASSGVLIALLYTLTLIPALLAITPLRDKKLTVVHKRNLRMDAILEGIAHVSVRRYRPILGVSAVIILLGLAGAAQVRFSHYPLHWLHEKEPSRIATTFVDEHMKGASTMEIIIDGKQENRLYEPQVMQTIERMAREIESIDQGDLFIGKALSLADILKEINKALNENRDEYYRIPEQRELIAQEFLLFENSGSDDLEDFVDSQFSKARMTVKMPWVDSTLYTGLIADLEQRFHKAFGDDFEISITGMIPLMARVMHASIISMAESYVIAFVVITLMMIVLMGSLRIGLISMIPNLTPIVLTLGLMGWFGMPLDAFTILIGSIAIGLAVDDTIHFMHNYRRYHRESAEVHQAVRQTLLTTGRAMLVTTIVLSSGFFLYAFADLSNLQNFGILTGFTIVMALLADFFLAPALMTWLHKAHALADE